MTWELRRNVAKILLVLVVVISLKSATGCYEWLFPDCSLPGSYYFGGHGFGCPTSRLHYPTNGEQDATEASNNAREEFIRK